MTQTRTINNINYNQLIWDLDDLYLLKLAFLARKIFSITYEVKQYFCLFQCQSGKYEVKLVFMMHLKRKN